MKCGVSPQSCDYRKWRALGDIYHSVFGFQRTRVHNVDAKYNESEKSKKGFVTSMKKTHSKELVVRTPNIIQCAQEPIFEDLGQLVRNSSPRWSEFNSATCFCVPQAKLLLNSVWLWRENVYWWCKINGRNGRWPAHDPKNILIVARTKFRRMFSIKEMTASPSKNVVILRRTKFSANVHVIAVLSTEGDVSSSKEKISQKCCLRALVIVVMNETKPIVSENNFTGFASL